MSDARSSGGLVTHHLSRSEQCLISGSLSIAFWRTSRIALSGGSCLRRLAAGLGQPGAKMGLRR